MRAATLFTVGALLVVGSTFAWASQPADPDSPPLAVPSFAGEPLGPGEDQSRRPTLLPTDCTELLRGPADASALLGQPVGSIGAHTTVGIGSPSVGMLERLTCNYRRNERGAPVLVVGLAAFTDPAAATLQRGRNLAVERGDARSARELSIGNANATLLDQGTRYLIMVEYDRYTVTMALSKGVVADSEVEPVLTDLARRIWADVAPTPSRTATPASAAPPTPVSSSGR